MLTKTVVILAVLFVSSISYAHGDEHSCLMWEGWTCVPGAAFSVDNVHQVHDMTGREGPHFLEGSWHETEPLLVDLHNSRARPSHVGILRWDSADGLDYGFPTEAKSLECYPSSRYESNTYLFSQYREGLKVWDRSKEEARYILPASQGETTRLLFHRKGEWLLIVTDYAKLFQVDLGLWTVTEINLPGGEDQALDEVALSSDGRLFAAAGGGTVGVWDTGTWEAWEPKPLNNDAVEVIRFTADASHLLVSYGTTVSRWSLMGKRLTFVERSKPFECFLSFTSLSVTSDTIVTGTTGGSLLVWDLMQEKFLFELPVGNGEVTELLTHPSGESVLTVIEKKKLYQIDMGHWSVTEINLSGSEDQALDALTFSNDGLLLAAAGGGTIGVWDTGSWEAWEPQPVLDDTIGILRFTDDDTHLLVSSGATVSRWSLIDRRLAFGQQLEPYTGRRQCIIRVGDISHDGSLLMTGDDCGQYRAWDLAGDAEMYIPQLHDAHYGVPVTVMQFSPDGRVLFVGSYAGFGLLFIHQPE